MDKEKMKREVGMKEYHKIQTCYKRDKKGKIMLGNWSLPEFSYLQNNEWIWTEKVDGTNVRIIWDGKDIKFGGKTDNAQMPINLLNKLSQLFSEDKKLLFQEKFGEAAVCFYGEGYGAKIQKGGGNYKSDGNDFVLFDININGWWLQRQDVDRICNCFGIRTVPVIGTGTLLQMIETAQNGFNSSWGDFLAEGIVARPVVELKTRNGHRIITKIKYKDFNFTKEVKI